MALHEGHWNWKDVSAIARFALGPSLVEQQQRQQSHAELAELLTLTSKSGRCRPEVNNQRTISFRSSGSATQTVQPGA